LGGGGGGERGLLSLRLFLLLSPDFKSFSLLFEHLLSQTLSETDTPPSLPRFLLRVRFVLLAFLPAFLALN